MGVASLINPKNMPTLHQVQDWDAELGPWYVRYETAILVAALVIVIAVCLFGFKYRKRLIKLMGTASKKRSNNDT